jgi:hypothetical protein
MRRFNLAFAILGLSVLVADRTSPASAQASGTITRPASFCSAIEAIIFSCRTGNKMVSVCASNDDSRSQGYVQDRFGKSNANEPLELTLPDGQVLPSRTATGKAVSFSGGGGA